VRRPARDLNELYTLAIKDALATVAKSKG
jgi:hypothetical protein